MVPLKEFFQKRLTAILVVLLTALVVSSAIYLTPLKHINIIEPSVRDIQSEEFHNLLVENKDKYLFIDVRPADAYNTLHAEGSINIPLHEFYNQRKVFPKKGKEIVLICSGGVASGVGYSYLQHFGFFNVHRIEGGIESWKKAGLPVVVKKDQ